MTEHATTYKELRRSRSDRMVAGVCGGLGRYFDVNPTFYRVGFVVLALLGGAGILIYVAAVLVMPDEGRGRVDRRGGAARAPRPALAGCSASRIAAVAGDRAPLPRPPLAARRLRLGACCCSPGSRCSPRSAAPRPAPWPGRPNPRRRAATVVLPPARRGRSRSRSPPSACSSSQPACSARSPAGASTSRGRSRFAVAAVAVGVALVGGAFLHLRVGGLVVIGLLLGVAAILASTIDVHLNDGIGDRTLHARLRRRRSGDDYKLGIGELEIDLGRPRAARRARRASTATSAIGHLLRHRPGRRRGARREPRRLGRQRACSATTTNGHDVDSTRRPSGRRRARADARARRRTSAPARSRWNAPYDERDGPPPARAQRRRPRRRRRLRRASPRRLDVDPTLVRLVFALLALAGGAGIALYVALWLYMRGQHWIAVAAAARRRRRSCSSALGLSGHGDRARSR